MLSSKGPAGVPGSALVALSATAAAVGAVPGHRGRIAARNGPPDGLDAGVTNLLGNWLDPDRAAAWVIQRRM